MKEPRHISDGDLELLMLDVLSRREREELYDSLNDQEVKQVKDEIEDTLEALAFHESRKPSKDVREKVLSDIISNSQEKASGHKFLMAASVSLTLVASTIAYFFYQSWQSAENQLEIALQENTYMADEARFTNQQIEVLQEGLAVLADPSYLEIPMKGLENYPGYFTSVYWNQETKDTYLHVKTLGQLNEDQQYQLWSIQEGKPVDSGVFEIEDNIALIKMKKNEAPQAFAITIEPQGGSESPTLENMVVIGNVSV